MRVRLIGALAALALAGFVTAEFSIAPSRAERAAAPSYVAAEGKVEAMPGYDTNLGTGELNGKIQNILVKEGDYVVKGEVVAQLDNADLEAQVSQGEQQLAVARSKLAELLAGARKEEILEATATLEGATARMIGEQNQLRRYRELRKKSLIPQATLDEQEATFKAAQAAVDAAQQHKKLIEEGPKPETIQLYRDEVKLAQANLEYDKSTLNKTIIRSPIDGVVIKQYLSDGEGVTPEIPIVAIADLKKVWINAEVQEIDIGKVKLGQKAEITSNAYPNQVFNGVVKEIANYAGERRFRPSDPSINLGLKVVQVKIAPTDHTPLRLGMTVDVKIPIGQ